MMRQVLIGLFSSIFLVVSGHAKEDRVWIESVVGEVTYTRELAPAKALRKSTRLRPGDLVRTLAESGVEFRFSDDNRFKLEENSILELSKLDHEKKNGKTQLGIKAGSIRFAVKKALNAGSSMNFETPTATAAIRGTEGGIGNLAGKTFAFLERGRLYLKAKNGSKEIFINRYQVALETTGGFSVKSVESGGQLSGLVEKIKQSMSNPDSTQPMDSLFSDSVAVDTILVPADSKVGTIMDSMPSQDTVPTKDTGSVGSIPIPFENDARLLVTHPKAGAEIRAGIIEATGKASPGAIVRVNQYQTKADPTGVWTIKIPAPKQPGEYRFTVEALAGGHTQTAEMHVIIAEVELQLKVLSPARGEKFSKNQLVASGISSPGAIIQIYESSAKADAAGRWSVVVALPRSAGMYDLRVEARFGSQFKSIEIQIEKTLSVLPITGTVVGVAAETRSAELSFSGTCLNGSKVVIGDFSTAVVDGSWKLKVSWPENEEGRKSFEVYCEQGERRALLAIASTIYTRPKVPLTLQVQLPNPLQQVKASLEVGGTVSTQASVTIQGQSVSLDANLQFSKILNFDESNWGWNSLAVVADNGTQRVTHSVQLTVDKTSGEINTQKPKFLLAPTMTNGKIQYGLEDHSADKVDVLFEVDGVREESYSFSGSKPGQTHDMKAGVHSYRILATDLAGNKITWSAANAAYWPRVEWKIIVLDPSGNSIRYLPPRVRQIEGNFTPEAPVRFRIQNLPNDDFKYLKEIRVFNEANGFEKYWRGIEIDDVEFEIPAMPLVRNRANRISIRIEPQEGPIRTETAVYDLR